MNYTLYTSIQWNISQSMIFPLKSPATSVFSSKPCFMTPVSLPLFLVHIKLAYTYIYVYIPAACPTYKKSSHSLQPTECRSKWKNQVFPISGISRLIKCSMFHTPIGIQVGCLFPRSPLSRVPMDQSCSKQMRAYTKGCKWGNQQLLE